MLRGNPGTGTRFTQKYFNNHSYYLSSYPIDSGVDLETIIETYKISNYFDIWYPIDTYRKALDVWGESVQDLKNEYCNTLEKGINWLYKTTGVKPPTQENFIKLPLDELLCPHCGESIFSYVKDKMGDGTLNAFFDIV